MPWNSESMECGLDAIAATAAIRDARHEVEGIEVKPSR